MTKLLGGGRPFTKVLMNPPYKLHSNSEAEFVNYALRQMKKRGYLFAVLPRVTISGKKWSSWRYQLLKRHTLKACIQFDKNLFYPVSEATYGLVLQSHIPHNFHSDVFMGRLFDDKNRPRLSKVLSEHQAVDNLEEMTDTVKKFLLGKSITNSVDRQQNVIKLMERDENCNWVPENYIPSGTKKINPLGAVIRGASAESVRLQVLARQEVPNLKSDIKIDTYPVSYFVENIERNGVRAIKDFPSGNVPVIGSTAEMNGISAWKNIPDKNCLENCISISTRHNTKSCQAFWHPYRFSAIVNNAIVFTPIKELLEKENAILYFCEAITAKNSWRYNYAHTPQIEKLEVDVPVDDFGEPNYKIMAEVVRQLTERQ